MIIDWKWDNPTFHYVNPQRYLHCSDRHHPVVYFSDLDRPWSRIVWIGRRHFWRSDRNYRRYRWRDDRHYCPSLQTPFWLGTRGMVSSFSFPRISFPGRGHPRGGVAPEEEVKVLSWIRPILKAKSQQRVITKD